MASRGSLGSRRSLRSVRSSATSIGSAPFYVPNDADDPSSSSSSQPPPTDADAKGWHPATAPLDYNAWPWKAEPAPEKRGSRGPRIYADQEWRKTKVEQIRASESSFREWAEDLTGEELGATAKDADRTADVTFGVWSCCKALPLLSSGCVGSQHTAEWAQCNACGLWVPLARWSESKCVRHEGAPRVYQAGGMQWSCCGAVGFDGTRADYKAVEEWRKWKNKPLTPANLREWQVWQVTTRRRQQTGTGEGTTGCKEGEHVCTPPPGCALPSCATCGMEAKPGQWCCRGCGKDERLCMQCWELHPAAAFEPPPSQQHPGTGAPPLPAAARRCRFHPGQFVPQRVCRYASKQPRMRPCAHAADGCDFSSDMSAEHARHARSCGFAPASCPHVCGVAHLQRRQLQPHLQVCPLVPEPCEWCAALLPRCDLADHRVTCPMRPIACAYCAEPLAKHDVDAHLASCPRVPVECVYCGAWAAREELVEEEVAEEVVEEEEEMKGGGGIAHEVTHMMVGGVQVDSLAPMMEGVFGGSDDGGDGGDALALAPAGGHGRGGGGGGGGGRKKLVVFSSAGEGARLLGAHLLVCPRVPARCLHCGATLPRDELDAHEDICAAAPTRCADCGLMLRRAEMPDHAPVCPSRRVGCALGCGAAALFSQWDAHTHSLVCPRVAVPCILSGCGASVHRSALNAHLAQDCPQWMLRCGRCGVRVARGAFAAHDRECLARVHLRAWRDALGATCMLCGEACRSLAALRRHEPTCPARVVACPHAGDGDSAGCGERGLLEGDLAAHLLVCPFVSSPCPYQCGAWLARANLPAHVKSVALALCQVGCGAVFTPSLRAVHMLRCPKARELRVREVEQARAEVAKVLEENDVFFNGARERATKESSLGQPQAWAIQHLDAKKAADNWHTIGLVAEILLRYGTLYCRVHGTTTAPKGGVADDDLAAHFRCDPKRDVQRVMDLLARSRAVACRDALISRGVPAEQLGVTFQGCAGEMKVDFIPSADKVKDAAVDDADDSDGYGDGDPGSDDGGGDGEAAAKGVPGEMDGILLDKKLLLDDRCPNLPVKCPRGCGETVRRRDLERHDETCRRARWHGAFRGALEAQKAKVVLSAEQDQFGDGI